jgi:vancomycin resistance protein YoaR
MNLGKKLLFIMFLGLFVMAGVGIWFELKYWKRAYPGITVSGINLVGKNQLDIITAIREKTDQINEIKLKWGTNDWTINIKDIGAKYYPETTTEYVIKFGRSGNLKTDYLNKLSGLRGNIPIELKYVIENDKLITAISSISAQINIPAREPEVTYDKTTGVVEVSPGENGQAVDELQLIKMIKTNFGNAVNPVVEIPVISLQPKLDNEQLESAKQRATNLVGKKLIVNFNEEGQKWELPDEELMTWVDPSTISGLTGWKKQKIENWVTELATTIDRPAQNASFQFISANRVQEFKPARAGIKIRQDIVSKNILEALSQLGLENTIVETNLVVDKVEPMIKNSEVNDLGIKELLGRGESWFSGSIDNRIFNLQKATAVLNGILVAPGDTFSFNQALGEISSNTGYKQAYVIKEGKTVLGDGGGVCQTSTTLFRAVLAAGLPITERFAHAYRVYYYEEKYQPGFDATVFQPSPDFKFKNDTPAYLLIQTSVDLTAKKLTYEIYGTSDGRKAEISKARTWEVTPPPPDLYVDDPNLKIGVVKQTEHAAWGAKVAFDWKVTRGEEVLQQRTFFSNYAPWQAVYLRGTKI